MLAKSDVCSGDNVGEVEAIKAATLIRIKQVMKTSSAKLYKLLDSEVSNISYIIVLSCLRIWLSPKKIAINDRALLQSKQLDSKN
jgi:hypothetical protein